jgi:membrane associated rhomboid family serine protease
MIYPVMDDNTDRKRLPYITWAVIAANILVFIFLQGFGRNDDFTFTFSTVPKEIITGNDVVLDEPRLVQDPVSGKSFMLPELKSTPVSVYLTLLTSMFMHGGFAHLFGNMLYLFIFGDNVEDRIGHVKFLVFYLLCGVTASLAHVFVSDLLHMNLLIPTLGASGAISAVLAGYVVLFPRRKVYAILFRILLPVPAIAAIGIWFVFQLISGIGLLGSGTQTGGVAYAAHVGGFSAGLVMIKLFDLRRTGS